VLLVFILNKIKLRTFTNKVLSITQQDFVLSAFQIVKEHEFPKGNIIQAFSKKHFDDVFHLRQDKL